jgi:hypothetical protein
MGMGCLIGVTTLVGNPRITGVEMTATGQLWKSQLLVLQVPRQSQADWLPGRHWLVTEHQPKLDRSIPQWIELEHSSQVDRAEQWLKKVLVRMSQIGAETTFNYF